MKLSVFILNLLLLSFSLTAAQPRLALTHIPKVLEFGNADAPYNRLLEQFVATKTIAFDYEFMPSSRANKLLNELKIDCIFPIIPTRTRSVQTHFSDPINGIKAHVFSLGPQTYSNLEQLNGKVVVYLRGYLFGDLIANTPSISFFPVTNQKAALGMLQKQRAHAYLDYVPDIRFVFTDDELSLLKYRPDAPFIKDYDRMECLETPAGKELMTQLNRFVANKKAQNQLRDILGNYYVSTD